MLLGLLVHSHYDYCAVGNWVRKGPSLRYAKKNFENNSTSIPQIGYLISILFKSPGPNMARPLLGSRDPNWVAIHIY